MLKTKTKPKLYLVTVLVKE